MFNKQCSMKNKETSAQVSDTTMLRRDQRQTNKKVFKNPFSGGVKALLGDLG